MVTFNDVAGGIYPGGVHRLEEAGLLAEGVVHVALPARQRVQVETRQVPPSRHRPVPGGDERTVDGAGVLEILEDGDASGTTAGRLSQRDARALLQSLRGDERRGMNFGTSAAPPTADSPLKDW